MKKKILTICLIVALAATAIIGGTLAYFTDTDAKTNTFTAGGVKIALIEEQRNADSSALVPFENNKNLMPIVGSAQGEQEIVGGVKLPTAENYVDKIMTIKNTGASAAYVRIFVAVPTALQNGQTPNAPRYDVLHWNFNGDSCAVGQWTDEIVVANPTVINGVEYKIYSRTYTTALKANEVTATPAYIGFYLDKTVDMNADGDYTVDWGNGPVVINYDLSKGVEIPVFAQAIQADGFDSAEAAFAASGLPANPWAK
ncbi:CalY family protein [bacterium]|nr:CalY family protein [bacterium]